MLDELRKTEMASPQAEVVAPHIPDSSQDTEPAIGPQRRAAAQSSCLPSAICSPAVRYPYHQHHQLTVQHFVHNPAVTDLQTAQPPQPSLEQNSDPWLLAKFVNGLNEALPDITR